MIALIFKTGTQAEKLHKIRILDNLGDFVEEKKNEGVSFSDEAITALDVFPISHCSTVFSVVDNSILKSIFKIKNPLAQNWGYSHAAFHESRYLDLSMYEGVELEEKTAEQNEKKDWVCYYLSDRELQLIKWLDANEVPNFVTEVFTLVNCMPDEFINL